MAFCIVVLFVVITMRAITERDKILTMCNRCLCDSPSWLFCFYRRLQKWTSLPGGSQRFPLPKPEVDIALHIAPADRTFTFLISALGSFNFIFPPNFSGLNWMGDRLEPGLCYNIPESKFVQTPTSWDLGPSLHIRFVKLHETTTNLLPIVCKSLDTTLDWWNLPAGWQGKLERLLGEYIFRWAMVGQPYFAVSPSMWRAKSPVECLL